MCGKRKNNNGNWVNKSGKLSTTIYYTMRFSDCSVDISDSETDDCNSCNSKQAMKTRSGGGIRSIANDDIQADFSAEFDNDETFSTDGTVKVCN